MTGPRSPRPLLLGLGWPPDQEGGLNRYFRELVTRTPDAAAVVVGPASDVPLRVAVASTHDAPLVVRMRAFARAAARAADETDVVDAHFALYAALPAHLGPVARLPLVVHFQGPWAAEAATQQTAGRMKSAVQTAVERSVYRRATRVVVLSGAFGRLLVQRYGVSPWRVRIVPPGVDLERFRPGDRESARAELGLPDDRPIVATVRRLVPRTGIHVLLDAWAGLDDGRALLCIAGDGPERSRLEQRARALGLQHVRFLGALPDASLPAFYRAADLSVVPSTALEGFGLVALESLASGTPVVVSDSGGLPEAVAALDPGVVVPAGDAGALRRRIAGVLDGTEPGPDGTRGRDHAEHFDWPRLATRHRQLYAEAVSPATRARVLFVDHCARLSGGEIAMLRLISGLADFDTHVIAFEDGPLLVALGAAGTTSEVVRMPARTVDLARARVGRRLPWSAAVDTAFQVGRIARRIRRLRPDVVHANSLKACLVAGVAARLARVPCVWHVRDLVDTDAHPPGAVRMVRMLARRVPTAIVANSASTLASLRLAPGARPLRAVVPDPLPEQFFAVSARRDADPTEPVVGIVGRLAPWKGQHVFLDAFARAFPDGGARAHVVGDALFGESAYRDGLHQQAAALGIDDRVDFRGFRHDVRAELEALDVLVHASIQPEPFGQVVVEGMAAGLPVVATACGGPAETIDDGRDGILVPPGDADALAATLRELVADAPRRRSLGNAGRVAAARYEAARIVPQVVEVYRGLGARR